MLARNAYLLSTFGNQVDEELTMGGVNTAHYTGGFVYINLESTINWKANWTASMEVDVECCVCRACSTKAAGEVYPAGAGEMHSVTGTVSEKLAAGAGEMFSTTGTVAPQTSGAGEVYSISLLLSPSPPPGGATILFDCVSPLHFSNIQNEVNKDTPSTR